MTLKIIYFMYACHLTLFYHPLKLILSIHEKSQEMLSNFMCVKDEPLKNEVFDI